MATSGCCHGTDLACVGIDYHEVALGGELLIKGHIAHVGWQSGHGRSRTCDELRDDAMAFECSHVRFNVLIHDELLERELPENHISGYLPILLLDDALQKRCEQGLQIEL